MNKYNHMKHFINVGKQTSQAINCITKEMPTHKLVDQLTNLRFKILSVIIGIKDNEKNI